MKFKNEAPTLPPPTVVYQTDTLRVIKTHSVSIKDNKGGPSVFAPELIVETRTRDALGNACWNYVGTENSLVISYRLAMPLPDAGWVAFFDSLRNHKCLAGL